MCAQQTLLINIDFPDEFASVLVNSNLNHPQEMFTNTTVIKFIHELKIQSFKGVHWPLLSERNNTALVTEVISVAANDSTTISFLNHNTIALVHNCLKLLSCVVIETALDVMKKNQLS